MCRPRAAPPSPTHQQQQQRQQRRRRRRASGYRPAGRVGISPSRDDSATRRNGRRTAAAALQSSMAGRPDVTRHRVTRLLRRGGTVRRLACAGVPVRPSRRAAIREIDAAAAPAHYTDAVCSHRLLSGGLAAAPLTAPRRHSTNGRTDAGRTVCQHSPPRAVYILL